LSRIILEISDGYTSHSSSRVGSPLQSLWRPGAGRQPILSPLPVRALSPAPSGANSIGFRAVLALFFEGFVHGKGLPWLCFSLFGGFLFSFWRRFGAQRRWSRSSMGSSDVITLCLQPIACRSRSPSRFKRASSILLLCCSLRTLNWPVGLVYGHIGRNTPRRRQPSRTEEHPPQTALTKPDLVIGLVVAIVVTWHGHSGAHTGFKGVVHETPLLYTVGMQIDGLINWRGLDRW
jgi:hypothetical protein